MLKSCILWLVIYFASFCFATRPPESDVVFELGNRYSKEPGTELQSLDSVGYLRRGGTEVTKLDIGTTIFKLSGSPYIVKSDIIVDQYSKLIIEPGVEVKSYPGVGIIVNGILDAKGYEDSPIILTSSNEPKKFAHFKSPKIRLVDGPSILAGRVQLFHHGKWYSLCTPSNNWTQDDFQVACQQLGFEGGKFWKWFPRENKQRPRMVYENPRCSGLEKTLSNCDWASRKVGGDSCNGHPDLGIQCSMYHRKTQGIGKHWRGIKFEYANSEMQINDDTVQREPVSLSRLNNVYIRYGGVGPHYSAVSALEIIGVPPEMEQVYVTHSAYNGIAIAMSNSAVNLYSVSANNNRGFGIYLISYYDPVKLSSCFASNNGADGVKYVRQDKTNFESLDDPDFKNLCNLSQSDLHTYPMYLRVVMGKDLESLGECFAVLEALPNARLTLSFLQMSVDSTNGGTAVIEVYDGALQSDPMLAKVDIKNGLKAQSVVSTENVALIKFKMKPNINGAVFMKVTATYAKYTDLSVISTTIENNNGHGISIENPLSMITLLTSYISNNSIAGINVLNGMSDINIFNSHTIFNKDGGINIVNLHGTTMINDSVISSNSGSGFAIQPSQDRGPSFTIYNETLLIRDSQIIRNSEYGLLIESFCSKTFINLTRNVFFKNGNNALDVRSCSKDNNMMMYILVVHNDFLENHMFDIKIEPAVNIEGVIESNNFSQNTHGCLLIRNREDKHLDSLLTHLTVKKNNFKYNNGTFVVNIGLSPSSTVQTVLFTRNVLANNIIHEPYEFSNLVTRNKVAAVIVVSSSNVIVFRNIIENPKSAYEIGTHLQNPNEIINCTYNWLGHKEEYKLVHRIFDRTDRYNLAQLEYIPFLLNDSTSYHTNTLDVRTYRQHFFNVDTHIGGEMMGIRILKKGTYIVQKDIHVLPGAKLVLQPGAVLRFLPSIGMLVSGELNALGTPEQPVVLTLENNGTENTGNKTGNVQLLGDTLEGLLLVRVGDKWGTVCSYGWTITDAAVVCHSLGYIVNPNDWRLSKESVSAIKHSQKPLLSNVQCNEDDVDILDCKSEVKSDFYNSCELEDIVGVRCHPPYWAGVRFGIQAERSQLRFVNVEKAGLFDYSTNSVSAAIQMDFARHHLNFTKVQDNLHDGLEIWYSNIYSEDINFVRNSTFQNNGGNGISIHHVGLKISGSEMSNNTLAGMSYSMLSKLQQQNEMVNFFKIKGSDNTTGNSSHTIVIPEYESGTIHIDTGDTLFILTEKITTHQILRHFQITCDPTHMIGVQILNPIKLESTERIVLYDSGSMNTASSVWSIKENVMKFPTAINSSNIVLQYISGNNSLGDVLLAVSPVPAGLFDFTTKKLQPREALTVYESKLTGNKNAIKASYSTRCHNKEEYWGGNFMELIEVSYCLLSDNKQEVIYVDSTVLDICNKDEMDVKFDINHSYISNNQKGILHTSRIHNKHSSTFHWLLQHNAIVSNTGSFELYLPYGWQPSATLTHKLHSVAFLHNVWLNNYNFELKIGGGLAHLNILGNTFKYNRCKTGLISIQGMEKSIYIAKNLIFYNEGSFMMDFSVDSQLEITVETALVIENELKGNDFSKSSCVNVNTANKEYRNFTSVLKFSGVQKVKVNRNLIANNCMDFNIIAGIKTVKLDDFIDATENWWGSTDEDHMTQRILQFDDWNNHVTVKFRPYLAEGRYNASLLDVKYNSSENTDNIDGRIFTNTVLKSRNEPYVIRRDITVMPNISLTVEPGVVMLFAPNVGLLVLGSFKAMGKKGEEIFMLPLESELGKMMSKQWDKDHQRETKIIRLCSGPDCGLPSSSTIIGTVEPSEGYLQFYDDKPKKWVPLCDPGFTISNAKVVCRELGFSAENANFDYEQGTDLLTISPYVMWPALPKCNGDEMSVQACPFAIRSRRCKQNSSYVYVYCEKEKVTLSHWGGIRFARSEFENDNQINSDNQHAIVQEASIMQYVAILGAGALHSENSPCIQIVAHSVVVHDTNITACVYDGINIVSSVHDTHLFHNSIESANGVGITITSLALEEGFPGNTSLPLQNLTVPMHLFGIHMCDASKVITVAEKTYLYFKFDGHPRVCTKIFSGANQNTTLGFRFLQFNLFNLAEEDGIYIHNGDIRKTPATLMTVIKRNNSTDWPFSYTSGQNLSVQLFISNATNATGFIAEVFALPILANASRNNVEHNISSCIIRSNKGGGIRVSGLNYAVNMEWNRIISNYKYPPKKLRACIPAVIIDAQNASSVIFKNNLLQYNQGGLLIQAKYATTLKGWVTNNMFSQNKICPALYLEGSKDNNTQEIQIFGNYFTKNDSPNIIVISEILSNFSHNAVTYNTGDYILKIYGYKKFYHKKQQTANKNFFYMNEASSTIFAGTPEQEYLENILLNPASVYEMTSADASQFKYLMNSSVINAQYNWWGVNSTEDVKKRILDYSVISSMVPVEYTPFYSKSEDVKEMCPLELTKTEDTCYLYIGAPMTFLQAVNFCTNLNASLPKAAERNSKLQHFLKELQNKHNLTDTIWVQDSKFGNKCTIFSGKTVMTESCQQFHSFVCTDKAFNFKPAEESILGLVFFCMLFIFIMIAMALCYVEQMMKFCCKSRRRQRVDLHQMLTHNEAYNEHDPEVSNSFNEENIEEIPVTEDAQSEDKGADDDAYEADTETETDYESVKLIRRPKLKREADNFYEPVEFKRRPIYFEADVHIDGHHYEGIELGNRPTLGIETDTVEGAVGIGQVAKAGREKESDECIYAEILGRLSFGGASDDVEHDGELIEMVEYGGNENNEYDSKACSQMEVTNETVNSSCENNDAIQETLCTKRENKKKCMETAL